MSWQVGYGTDLRVMELLSYLYTVITFLRNIRRSLIESGSARKYIIYAIGEIALVVIGILIALQINNYNNHQIEKKKEIHVLKEVQNIIRTDLPDLKAKYRQITGVVQDIQDFQDKFESGARIDSLERVAGRSYGIWYFELKTSAYEDLRSRGFDLISDDQIRSLIIKIYDTHYKAIEGIKEVEKRANFDVFRPYYLENFTKIKFYQSAIPNDPKALFADPYWHNLLDYRLKTLRYNHLSFYPPLIEDLELLLEEIRNYLEENS